MGKFPARGHIDRHKAGAGAKLVAAGLRMPRLDNLVALEIVDRDQLHRPQLATIADQVGKVTLRGREAAALERPLGLGRLLGVEVGRGPAPREPVRVCIPKACSKARRLFLAMDLAPALCQASQTPCAAAAPMFT